MGDSGVKNCNWLGMGEIEFGCLGNEKGYNMTVLLQ